jgi:ureidoglycolate hydrolase
MRRVVEMQQIAVSDLSAESFAPFGMVGQSLPDGFHGAGDVALDLSQGLPRFYLMRLADRGTVFDLMARHDRVTQCLGTIDGLPWLIAVAPADVTEPQVTDISAFRIPADCFVTLARGTWHAGPYFTEVWRNFYNLELVDTNTADHRVCRLARPVEFGS